MSPVLRATYMANYREDYEFYVDLLMWMRLLEPSAGYDAAALAGSERARARSLTELVVEAGMGIRQGADPATLERKRELVSISPLLPAPLSPCPPLPSAPAACAPILVYRRADRRRLSPLLSP
jgi:hypothetical protein